MKTPVPIETAVARAVSGLRVVSPDDGADWTARVPRRAGFRELAWRAFVVVVFIAFIGMCAYYLCEEWVA